MKRLLLLLFVPAIMFSGELKQALLKSKKEQKPLMVLVTAEALVIWWPEGLEGGGGLFGINPFDWLEGQEILGKGFLGFGRNQVWIKGIRPKWIGFQKIIPFPQRLVLGIITNPYQIIFLSIFHQREFFHRFGLITLVKRGGLFLKLGFYWIFTYWLGGSGIGITGKEKGKGFGNFYPHFIYGKVGLHTKEVGFVGS